MATPDPHTGWQPAADSLADDHVAGDAPVAGESVAVRERRRPDSAIRRSNRGWEALQRGEPEEAIPHFREALRLAPDFPAARAGIVESLKARHPLYRWLLRACFWLAKLPPSTQIALMAIVYLGSRLISSLAVQSEDGHSLLWPLMMFIFFLSAAVGLASPFFNLLLRFDPAGNQALGDDLRRGTNLLILNLLLPLPLLVWAIARQDGLSLVVWMLLSLVALPSSSIYRCLPGWPRWLMSLVTVALVAIVLPLLASIFFTLPAWLDQEQGNLIAYFIYGLIGSQIVATALTTLQYRR